MFGKAFEKPAMTVVAIVKVAPKNAKIGFLRKTKITVNNNKMIMTVKNGINHQLVLSTCAFIISSIQHAIKTPANKLGKRTIFCALLIIS